MANPTPRQLYMQLSRRGKEVKCLKCADLVLPRELVKHMSDKHSDIGNACPWCLTKTFEAKHHRYYVHLLRCLRIAKLAAAELRESEFVRRVAEIDKYCDDLSEKYKITENAIDVKKYLKRMNVLEEPCLPPEPKQIKKDAPAEAAPSSSAAAAPSRERPIELAISENEEDDFSDGDYDTVYKVADTTSNYCNTEVCQAYFDKGGLCRKERILLKTPSNLDAPESFFMDLNTTDIPEWISSVDGVEKNNIPYFLNKMPVDEITGINSLWHLAFLYKSTLTWCHVSIRIGAWDDFMKFREFCGEKIYFLPYSCLCNGGKIIHRHMIMVTLKTDKHEVRNQYMSMIRSSRTEPTKFMRWMDNIQHPLYLVNTINYLSNIASQCMEEAEAFADYNESINMTDFHGLRKFKSKKKRGSCHFYIFKSIIPYAEVFQALLTPVGVNHLLSAKCKNSLPLLGGSIRRNTKNQRWEVLIKELYRKHTSLVFPLPKNCQLKYLCEIKDINTFEYVEAFLFVGTTVFSYEIREDLMKLNRLEWNRRQIDADNQFFANAKNQYIMLGKHGQQIMNRSGILMRNFQHEIAKTNLAIHNLQDQLREQAEYHKIKEEDHKKELIKNTLAIQNLQEQAESHKKEAEYHKKELAKTTLALHNLQCKIGEQSEDHKKQVEELRTQVTGQFKLVLEHLLKFDPQAALNFYTHCTITNNFNPFQLKNPFTNE